MYSEEVRSTATPGTGNDTKFHQVRRQQSTFSADPRVGSFAGALSSFFLRAGGPSGRNPRFYHNMDQQFKDFWLKVANVISVSSSSISRMISKIREHLKNEETNKKCNLQVFMKASMPHRWQRRASHVKSLSVCVMHGSHASAMGT